MTRLIFILTLFFILMNCASSYDSLKYSPIPDLSAQFLKDTVDYCLRVEKLRKWRIVTDSTPQDSSKAYVIANIICLHKKIFEHNKTGLTTDTCLCRKRLANMLENSIDSEVDTFNISIEKKQIIILPKNSNVLGGVQYFKFGNSCHLDSMAGTE